jgi:hypothetical protein
MSIMQQILHLGQECPLEHQRIGQMLLMDMIVVLVSIIIMFLVELE